jgi:hypothetical protein
MHHWGCPLWVVVAEIAPCGCGHAVVVVLATSSITPIITAVAALIVTAITLPVVTQVVAVTAMISVTSVIVVVVVVIITLFHVVVVTLGPAVAIIMSIGSTVTVVEMIVTILVVVVAALGFLRFGRYSKGTLQLLTLPYGMFGVAVELALVVLDHVEVAF